MNEVILYTTGYCPYCIKAKELLDRKKVIYTEIRVDLQPELREEMI
ncbi:TPA: glutaredoxin 3, partial [Legionella pneumophila]|nr:glutaredoxin 3 [Legionella pneumophila]